MTTSQLRRQSKFPQAPRNRTVVLGSRLLLPNPVTSSLTHIRSQIAAQRLSRATPSSVRSLETLAAVIGNSSALSAPPSFRDELEHYIDVEAVDHSSELAKAKMEWAVYSRLISLTPLIQHTSFEDFLTIVLDIHRRLGAGSNSWRQVAVGLRPDRAGNRVVFPPYRHCRDLLSNLHEYLIANTHTDPFLSACAALVTVLYAHPFDDGNGRTARVLYNLVVGSALRTRHFIPLPLMTIIHRGSFLIKLRRVLYGGEWKPLQALLTDAAHLSCTLQDCATVDGMQQ